MVDDYMMDKVLEKIKKIIGIEKLKQMINCQTMLLQKMLMTYVVKNNGKFYQQLFLEEVLFLK